MISSSPLFSRWARALRATYVPACQNPRTRRIPKSPLFDRHHFSLRFLSFFRMEETPISSFGGAATAGSSSPAGRREMVGDVDCFELSASSVLKLQKGDITSWFVDGATDAIVNAANERMLGGGGVDGAIHRAAGPELKAACFEVPEVRPGVRCPTGEARITPAFQLPVSRVIHTVGPIFGAVENPEVLLRNAYRNSLILAKENNIQYIAFPAISCGVYRYPCDDASKIALFAIKEFPSDFKEVHFVLFSDDVYRAWLESAIEFM
ncbi:Transcription factor bHLH140 [Platanthera zijinensis]|uniref:Transcription factor bHLH140 n=1 Tax=Platanthera zijinensis TaxID=2320716 RepID=A0AAP0ATH5_9ASPA